MQHVLIENHTNTAALTENLVDLLDNLSTNTRTGKLHWKVTPNNCISTDTDDIYVTNIFNCNVNNEISLLICFDLTNQFITIKEYIKSGLQDLNKVEIKNHYIGRDYLSRTEVQDRMAILFGYIMSRRKNHRIIETSTTLNQDHINKLNLCLEGLTSLFAGIWQQESAPVDITDPMFKLTVNE